MEKCGIETLYKYKGRTDELQGISFKLAEYKFKGSSNDRKIFEANDIKYRALKITGNKPLLELLYKTDSLFDLNRAKFHEYVVAQEYESKKQADRIRIAAENKNIKNVNK